MPGRLVQDVICILCDTNVGRCLSEKKLVRDFLLLRLTNCNQPISCWPADMFKG